MTLDSVVKINGVVSRIEGRSSTRMIVVMHGRRKQLTNKGKLIENSIQNGQFRATTAKI